MVPRDSVDALRDAPPYQPAGSLSTGRTDDGRLGSGRRSPSSNLGGEVPLSAVVVTGAAGFLGSHLVDRLLECADKVLGIDDLTTGSLRNLREARASPRFRFRKADLVHLRKLPAADWYFHLASPASPPAYSRNPVGTLRVNSEGTLRVLEEARRGDSRVVIASTSEVYGDPEINPQSESYWGHVNPIGPRSCYDEGKRFSEALATAYRGTYALDVRIARIFNTYGPRMALDDGRVISNFIVQGLKGEPFSLYGNGRQTRSFCYVSDLIDGLTCLAKGSSSIPTPLNLGNPRELTIRETARLTAKVLGVPFRSRYLPLPEDDPKHRSPDISRAHRYLRWAPKVPLEDGLQKTAEDFRRRLRSKAEEHT
jgi:nucleoside-diphosphate-sugar epimerase